MAKQRTHTLSPAAAAQLREVFKRVLGKGVLNGTTRTADDGPSIVGRWVKFTSYGTSPFAHDRKVYLADLHLVPGSTNVRASGIKVLNSWEYENTATLKAGYTIVTSSPGCGDITGISPLPLGQWYEIRAVQVISGVKYAIVTQRNDAIYQTT